MPRSQRLRRIALRTAGLAISLVVVMAVGFAIGVFVQSRPDWALLGSARTDAEFERKLEAYLRDNPQVIADALERHLAERGDSPRISTAPTRRRGAGRPQRAISAEQSRQLHDDPASPVGGNPNGDVTLVEFFDYNCPFCRQMLPTLSELAATNPQLRIVYKEFPILAESSSFAARAALAARKQGKYLAFHAALMRLSGTVNPDKVFAAARAVGLDVDRLRGDMDGPEIAAAIERNLALARSLRIPGTPSFVVGDRIFRGAADGATLQALTDRES